MCSCKAWYRVTFCFVFKFLATPRGMWDPGSPNKNQTHVPCIGSRVSTNHWTSREVPLGQFPFFFFNLAAKRFILISSILIFIIIVCFHLLTCKRGVMIQWIKD